MLFDLRNLSSSVFGPYLALHTMYLRLSSREMSFITFPAALGAGFGNERRSPQNGPGNSISAELAPHLEGKVRTVQISGEAEQSLFVITVDVC